MDSKGQLNCEGIKVSVCNGEFLNFFSTFCHLQTKQCSTLNKIKLLSILNVSELKYCEHLRAVN